jgi:hypothetical protein
MKIHLTLTRGSVLPLNTLGFGPMISEPHQIYRLCFPSISPWAFEIFNDRNLMQSHGKLWGKYCGVIRSEAVFPWNNVEYWLGGRDSLLDQMAIG